MRKVKELNIDVGDYKNIAINDAIHNFMIQKLLNLGFIHLYDNKKIALEIIKKENINGFCLFKNDFKINYYLLHKVDNIQKGREKALDLLSALSRIFEKLGIYLMEFTSQKENTFYLINYSNNVHLPIKAIIKKEYVIIEINNLFDMFIENLPNYFNPYSFAYILQNKNRSEMIKKDQELKSLKGYKLQSEEINAQLEEAKNLQLNIILTTSISLIEKEKYRVILDNNLENIKEVNSNELVEFLLTYNKKNIIKNYKENMKKTMDYFSSNLVNNLYICIACLKKEKSKIILKYLVQENDSCYYCKVKKGLKYLLIERDKRKS